MVNCDTAGQAIFVLPATMARVPPAAKVTNLKVAWDTGAMTTTSPSTNYMQRLENLSDVFVRGVVGEAEKIKVKGLYFPTVQHLPNIPLVALHIPGSPYILISISQFCKEYNAAMVCDAQGAFLWNKDGLLATATVKDGLYLQDDVARNINLANIMTKVAQQLQVPNRAGPPTHISCLSFSMDTLRWLHLASNHIAFSTLRKIHNFPPADKDHPDPICQACCEASMPRDKIPKHKLEKPSRPHSDLTFDISRRKATDHRGNQRAVVIACRYSDLWSAIPVKRKSESGPAVTQYIDRVNNRHAPHRVATITTDGECPMSEDFRLQLKLRGVQLLISAPYQQWQNPAEATMKRWDKAVHALMFTSAAPKGSWSFASNHACYVHNRIALPGEMSPVEKATGIPPVWDQEKVFGQKCDARLFVAGKEEKKSVGSIYLGHDEFCNADIVRPSDPNLASGKERYAKVTRNERGVFPYTFPTVPRPHDRPYIHYESDSDDDIVIADNAMPVPHSNIPIAMPPAAQFHSMLPDGVVPNVEAVEADEAVDVADNSHDPEIVDYDDPEVEIPVQVAPRASGRKKTMSAAGAASAASANDSYYFTTGPMIPDDLSSSRSFRMANILQSIILSPPDPVATVTSAATAMLTPSWIKTFDVCLSEEKSNPFADLFDVRTMDKWKDPKSLKDVMSHPMKEHFLAAREKEKQAWVRNEAYKIVKRSDIKIDPSTAKPYKVMRYHEVWKTKWNQDSSIDKFKNRVTANGKFQNKDIELCYESMVTIPSIRIGFDLATRFGLEVAHTDAMEFYLQHKIRDGEEYYMDIPEGWTEHDPRFWVMHLQKAAYGIPSAGQTAGHKLTEYLGEIGFKPCPHDNKFYVKWVTETTMVAVMAHSDDLIWFGTSRELTDQHIALLRKRIPMTPTTWNPTVFRGIEIIYHPNGDITLHQAGYIKDFLKDFELEGFKFPDTPGINHEYYQTPVVLQASKQQIAKYMIRQGKLQWASLSTPSCAYMINWLARYMQNPQTHHVRQQQQCILYMVSIAEKGITFRRKGPVQQIRKCFNMDCVLGWADATWADRADDKDARSTTGFLWETDQGVIMWYTGKQNNITLSSCESEVMSNKTCCQTGVWIRGFYTDLGATFTKPTTIMQDNTGAVAMAKSDANHTKSRHYRVACAYIRECYNRRIFTFEWVQTNDMKADVLTKPLNRVAHSKHEYGITRYQAHRDGK